jgi:hypothetical protein
MVFGHKIPVVLRTTAGDELREFAPDLRLIEVCRLLRVPPNAISTFATGSTSTRRVVGLYEPLGRLVRSDGEQLVLQFDRNLNPQKVSLSYTVYAWVVLGDGFSPAPGSRAPAQVCACVSE